ncbi:hypothetical protein PPROV_000517000 [Pycnococcus provasolii]|uniref:Uncharacterized protein n=1 Tax=Pycnococcus provasolii TaxID=41880 RepID=A0A830HHZ3_9CHLO|nr:hypothetical protein PPROV_000517000 [Pycnococcus provasolii]
MAALGGADQPGLAEQIQLLREQNNLLVQQNLQLQQGRPAARVQPQPERRRFLEPPTEADIDEQRLYLIPATLTRGPNSHRLPKTRSVPSDDERRARPLPIRDACPEVDELSRVSVSTSSVARRAHAAANTVATSGIGQASSTESRARANRAREPSPLRRSTQNVRTEHAPGTLHLAPSAEHRARASRARGLSTLRSTPPEAPQACRVKSTRQGAHSNTEANTTAASGVDRPCHRGVGHAQGRAWTQKCEAP